MGYDHGRIKENARIFYKNNSGSCILSQLIFIGVIVGIMSAMYIAIFVQAIAFAALVQEENLTTSIVQLIISEASTFVIFASVSLVSMGMMNWYRKSIFTKTSLGEIFLVFKWENLLGNVGVMFLMQLFAGLWTLLFFVPGIIKAYSYSQAVFIKSENPKISATRAIKLSQIMMKGHKGDIFYLQLSFIGWSILSVFTYNILGVVYVYPYYYSALAFAYVEIKADAIARGVIDPSEFENTEEYIAE